MLFRLAAATGMSRGELLGLRWSDVHLDTGRIEITQALTAIGYSHVLPRQQAAAAAAFATLVDDGPTCDGCGEPLDDGGPLCDRWAPGPNDQASAGNEPASLPDSCPAETLGPSHAEGPILGTGPDLRVSLVAGAGFEPATFGL